MIELMVQAEQALGLGLIDQAERLYAQAASSRSAQRDRDHRAGPGAARARTTGSALMPSSCVPWPSTRRTLRPCGWRRACARSWPAKAGWSARRPRRAGASDQPGRPAVRAASPMRILVTWRGRATSASVTVERLLAAGHSRRCPRRSARPATPAAVPTGGDLSRASYTEGTPVRPAARRAADRGDPALRRALAGRRVDPRAVALLPGQRGRRRSPCSRPPGPAGSAGSCSARRRPSTACRPRPRSRRRRRSTRSTPTARRSGPSRAALRWYGSAYGLRSVALRYFNVAGASQRNGEDHDPETHLIPNILAAVGRGPADDPLRRRLSDPRRDADPRLHPRRGPGRGPPGSRSRRPARPLAAAASPALALNLGTGSGFSVRDVVLRAAEDVVGATIPATDRPAPRGRPPDPGRRGRACPRDPRLDARPGQPGRDDRVGLGLAAGPSGRLPRVTR